MTQADLAHKARVDVGTISRIEREEQRASKRVRRALVRILGLRTQHGEREVERRA
jgi:ribosome-binding protein aMBF1 (putative translation factor)